jgi:Stage II sporulation protein E (SpoIIE)
MPSTRESHTHSLEPRTSILFYTDGLTEFRRDIEGGERAILRAAAYLVENPKLERPAAYVQRTVMGHARSADDTVILVVQITAPPALFLRGEREARSPERGASAESRR